MYQGRNYALATVVPTLAQSATLPICNIIGTAAVRSMIYEFTFGSYGTAADNAAEIQIQRGTTVGTPASAPTLYQLDPNDPAPVTTSGIATFTGGPTLTANAFLYSFGLNQRATFRWIAAPGSELKIPATASNGLNFMCQAVTTGWTPAFTVLVAE